MAIDNDKSSPQETNKLEEQSTEILKEYKKITMKKMKK
jgi:hypothetical protein